MKIIDQLLIAAVGLRVPMPDGAEDVKPYQIVLLVSIADRKIDVLPDGSPRFPAIRDTGHNHNFAMRQAQMERWTPITLPRRGKVEVGGFFVPLLVANVWIHPSQPGTIDSGGQPPFRLELEGGIAVYPPDVPNSARLPLLGLRGLIRNKLRLTFDGEGQHLTLESLPLDALRLPFTSDVCRPRFPNENA
jgi:hypothetical protein